VALPSGGVHCGKSTICVQHSRVFSQEHASRGKGYVAAPVFGRPEAAEAKKLWIVLAGENDALARCKPLFDALGQGTFPMGEAPEQASLANLCGNFIIASLIEMFGEVLTLAEKGGLDPSRTAGAVGG